MKPIETATPVEAWLQACEHLLDRPDWRDYTLVLEIAEPLALPPGDRAAYDVLDAFLVRKGGLPVSTVVNTIFPAQLYLRQGVQGVYERYPSDIYPQIKKHPDYSWGTYFHRLLQRSSPDGRLIYPLRDLIAKLKTQLIQAGPNRAIYEAGILHVVEDVPIYAPDLDRHRPIGGPCLIPTAFSHDSWGFHDGRCLILLLMQEDEACRRASRLRGTI